MKYTIKFKLTNSNGAIVDESTDESPLIFEPGDGQLDACLESCVEESKVGVPQTFLLMADEAFGQVDDEAMQEMEITMFPEGIELSENLAVEFKTPTGDSYVGTIREVKQSEGMVVVDFNHPLAGCDLTFVVEVIKLG